MQLIGPAEQPFENELDVIQSLVDLQGARILELGCGAAEKTQQLVALAPTLSITASEVDLIQHEKNLANSIERVTFKSYGAEAIDEADASFDGVMSAKNNNDHLVD